MGKGPQNRFYESGRGMVERYVLSDDELKLIIDALFYRATSPDIGHSERHDSCQLCITLLEHYRFRNPNPLVVPAS